jgi:ribosomal protein S18 acetylase RimI-like enzyme
MPDSSPHIIRVAEARDADEIAEVHTIAMREAMPYLPHLHTDAETRSWVAEVVLPRQEVWVAEAGGRVVGVAALEGEMLQQLYILPGYQGRGIGSDLLALAKSRRPDGLRLYAFQRNTRARAFYERRGFVAIAFGDGSGNEEGEPDVLYEWRRKAGGGRREGSKGAKGAKMTRGRHDRWHCRVGAVLTTDDVGRRADS